MAFRNLFARIFIALPVFIVGYVGLTVQSGAEVREPEIVIVPAHADGRAWNVHVQIFKPEGQGPFPLIIFSHGRSAKSLERKELKSPVLRGHVEYWMQKGFAVLAPIRPGYGETGGDDIENSGIKITASGECRGTPDFGRVAKNAADSVSDVINWAKHQPWSNKERILLVGQSVGGLATVALGARNIPSVVGYINFSGGAGENPEFDPAHSCFPAALEDVYRQLGKTTHRPNLWLYARNDQYWGADAPVEWHKAFAGAGGTGQFIQTDDVPDEDGHKLLAKGGKLWSVHVDAFVKSLGFKN